jgi:hypothetical protein
MTRKLRSRPIPAAIRELAERLEGENEVFQNHVLDFVCEVIEDPLFHRGIMALHRERFPSTNPRELLKELDAGRVMRPWLQPVNREGHLDPECPAPRRNVRSHAQPVRELLALVRRLKHRSHTSLGELADLIAAELVHRRWWEQALKRHPNTLRYLKNRLGP